MTRFRLAAALTAASTFLLPAACGDGRGWTGTVRDSAGVEILENTDQGTWQEGQAPAFREVIRIGSAAGDSLYQFGRIIAADIASDGSIYVLDMQNRVVRVYDSAGKYVRNIGRAGTGPGELQNATALIISPGDSILVPDMGKLGISRFATDGSPLEQLPMQLSDGIPFKWVELSSGRVVVQLRLMNIPGRATVTEPKDIFVLRESDGRILDTLLVLPAGESIQFGGPGQMRMRVFSPETMWTISDDGTIYQGLNTEYSINAYDTTGTIRRIVRRSVEARPVTEEDKDMIRKIVRDAAVAQGAPEAAMEAFVQNIEFAPLFPKIGNIMTGPAATLWVQRTQTAEEMKALGEDFDPQELGSPNWDVYGPDGKLMGLVKMPDRFTPLRWVGNRLVGVLLDENDVQHLAVEEWRVIG